MGFESSRAARRRLATIASTNNRVSEAMSHSAFPGFFSDSATPGVTEPPNRSRDLPADDGRTALARQLDLLAHDIVATPGAGGALLAAYASQARALLMVVEAAKRAGASPLPAAVVIAVQAALRAPDALAGLAVR